MKVNDRVNFYVDTNHRPMAGLVCYVHNDGSVNLAVWDHTAHPYDGIEHQVSLLEVPVIIAPALLPADGPYCTPS